MVWGLIMSKVKSKTKKSAAKRFSTTGSGKVKRYRAAKGHLLTGKSRKRKRKLRQRATVHSTELTKLRRMLPYG